MLILASKSQNVDVSFLVKKHFDLKTRPDNCKKSFLIEKWPVTIVRGLREHEVRSNP